MLLYCHINTEGQVVFAYFLFFVLDAPTVPVAFEIEGTIGVLAGLTDSWTDLWYYGHQGVNLRAFILTALFGGLHWFMIGNLTSYAAGWVQQRSELRRQPVCAGNRQVQRVSDQPKRISPTIGCRIPPQ